ncbi:hypothetical protein ACJX0J_006783, partial [Zea mays]
MGTEKQLKIWKDVIRWTVAGVAHSLASKPWQQAMALATLGNFSCLFFNLRISLFYHEIVWNKSFNDELELINTFLFELATLLFLLFFFVFFLSLLLKIMSEQLIMRLDG